MNLPFRILETLPNKPKIKTLELNPGESQELIIPDGYGGIAIDCDSQYIVGRKVADNDYETSLMTENHYEMFFIYRTLYFKNPESNNKITIHIRIYVKPTMQHFPFVISAALAHNGSEIGQETRSKKFEDNLDKMRVVKPGENQESKKGPK